MNRRHLFQWLILPVVPLTIGLGWKYPLAGFAVPVTMLAGIIGGFLNGRYVCGHFCPRGGFLDRAMGPIAGWREIPAWMRNMRLRWILFAAMMGFMIARVLADPADVRHWGRVFWMMCTLTTAIAVVLALVWRPRAWCALCPIGTFQKAVGGRKGILAVNAKTCVACSRCERICPINLAIAGELAAGSPSRGDCLKCGECVAACPAGALGFTRRSSAGNHLA